MRQKIFSLKEITKILPKIKSKKKKIVLCHGVFDLLHIGHIKHFEQSKSFGDILIVSITKDQFINKGPNRPAFNEQLRSKTLASLSVIDYVVLAPSKTAIEVIKYLKPNIYAKGIEYKDINNDLTGKIRNETNAVKKVKGKIIFTDDITFSSSKLLNSQIQIHSDDQQKIINKIKKNFNLNSIYHLIEKLKNFNSLVFGEAIIDQYIMCEALGRSGKDPILMFDEIESKNFAGGSVAIANNLSDFYKEIELYCSIGEEKEYLNFIKRETKKRVKSSFFYKKDSPTIIKKKYLDNITKNKLFGTYNINENFISQKEEENIIKKFNKDLKKKDVVILSDYGHGLVTDRIAKFLCKNSKFLIINAQSNAANTGFSSLKKYKNFDALIINERELREELRNKDEKIEILIRKISKKHLIKNIILTRGSEGSILYNSKNNKFYYCVAFANNIIDKIGSGDVMMSVIAGFLKLKCDPGLALFISSIAAGKSVESLANSNPVNKISLKKSLSHILN